MHSLAKALAKHYLIPASNSHGFNKDILLEYCKADCKYTRVPAKACRDRVGF